MNTFENLAKSINVKLGKKWLANNGLYYRINKKNIEFYNEHIDSWQEHLSDYKDILLGNIRPIKETAIGDIYYYIDFTSITGINIKEFKNDKIDKILFDRQVAFPTLELADRKKVQLLSV